MAWRQNNNNGWKSENDSLFGEVDVTSVGEGLLHLSGASLIHAITVKL